MKPNKVENQYSYKADGVIVKDEDIEADENGIRHRSSRKVKRKLSRGRVLSDMREPSIYVDDGSSGSNLKFTYSYKVYNEGEKPSYKNLYSNAYKSAMTAATTYNSSDATRLHPTADHGGYSDYFSVRKR